MAWPAVCPDLKPIENVWSQLVRAFFSNVTQYAAILELKAVFIRHWEELDKITLTGFVRSMPDRDFLLILKSGAYTVH